jgi:hypothetical protein
MRISMDGKKALLFATLMACFPAPVSAAVIELSGMVAYSKTQYDDGYRAMQRRYTASIDFKFTPVSALQFEYTDSTSKVSYMTDLGQLLAQDTRQHVNTYDKIYSFNWVQNLVPAKWIVQPYFLLGGGKMVRKYTIEVPELSYSLSGSQNQTTGVGGVGLRIFLTKNMAVKTEMKTYVPKFQFSKWKENQMMSAGLSWMF